MGQLNTTRNPCLNPGLQKPNQTPQRYKEHYEGNWRSLNLDFIFDSSIVSIFKCLKYDNQGRAQPWWGR